MNNEIIDNLKGLLGDDAEEKIQSVMDGLKGGADTQPNTNLQALDTLNYVNQIKNIIGQMENSNDSRSNLLLSLKPYMRNERQKSIDSVVKVLNLTKIVGLFK